MRRLLLLMVLLTAPSVTFADSPRPSEDELFGEAEQSPDTSEPNRALPTSVDPVFRLAGSLYLRLRNQILWEGPLATQRLNAPNLLDLSVDARPNDRLRGFASGRLSFDPTVSEGDVDWMGREASKSHMLLDQLWIKTDLNRTVFVTAGVQRIKWGASRLWNPTDFVNAQRKNPLDFFDVRTGVSLLKFHLPMESLGWNAYALAFFDGASRLEDIGGALRLEMVLGEAELSLSAMDGKGRKTSFGAELTMGIGDIDFHAEVALTDERGTHATTGTFDLMAEGGPVFPTRTARNAFYARASGGLTTTFKSSDTDVMIVGGEFFFNPLGVTDKSLYPWLIAQGELEPFYAGKYYAALFWMVPSPGSWDDLNLTTSTLANLSDMSFVTRLDMSVRIHHMLRLEAYAMFHYGTPGGEFRFEFEIPEGAAELWGQPLPEGKLAAPMLDLGINLRMSL